jgi:type I restriction enzyme S subunit
MGKFGKNTQSLRCDGRCRHQPDTPFTYIDVSSIDKSRGVIIDQVQILAPEDAPSRARKLVSNGTVIYSTVRPYLLNIAIIDRDFSPEPIVSTAFGVLHPFDGILNRYIYYYLRSSQFIEYVEGEMSGIAYPAINDSKLWNGPIPLPPTAEQHRIVAKVDELMALCDELEARQQERRTVHVHLNNAALDRLTSAKNDADFKPAWTRIRSNFYLLYSVPDNVNTLRQSILQLAVQGKLVPQDPRDEPASKTVKRVESNRRQYWEEQKLKALAVKGKKPTDDKWKNKYKPPCSMNIGEPFQIPSTSSWVTWEQVLAIDEAPFKRGPFGSTLQKAYFVESGYKVYEQYCPINDDCSFARYFITPEKFKEMKSFAVKAGDFLISCSGVTLGRITQVPEDFDEGIINQALLRVRVHAELINSVYFKVFFRSPYFQEQIFSNSMGSAIPNVKGVKNLKAIPIPLPPLTEQNRIVERVQQLMALCDELEAKLTQQQTDADRLTEAMVAAILNGAAA